MFVFADTDVKFDQPQAEVVIDRDKVRVAWASTCSQVGAGPRRRMLGGNFVNRFSIEGRSYKVIPQIERADRLTPDQLEDIYVTGAGRQAGAAVAPSPRCKTTTEPRALKRFQQLNAVRIQGVIPPGVSLDEALALPRDRGGEDPAAGLHDRLHRRVAPAAHRGQQVPRHVPALGDPDLPRARGAVQQLPRSVRHPRRLGAAGDVRRAALHVPRAAPRSTSTPRSAWSRSSAWSPKNGILIVEFANQLQETGSDKLDAVIEAAGDPPAARS